jgi:Arm DNA-binding domain
MRAATNKRKLTELYVAARKPGVGRELTWDAQVPGLALSVLPTGRKSWLVIYRHRGRPVWLKLGDARVVGLGGARQMADQGLARRH